MLDDLRELIAEVGAENVGEARARRQRLHRLVQVARALAEATNSYRVMPVRWESLGADSQAVFLSQASAVLAQFHMVPRQ